MGKNKELPIVTVARELNQVLGLEPAINLKATEKVLKGKVSEAAVLLEADDEVTETTQAFLEEMGVWVDHEAEAKPKGKKKGKKDPPPEEEEEDDGEIHSVVSLGAMNFMKLKKLAREMGASDEGKKPIVIAAILAVQDGDDEPAPKAKAKKGKSKEKATPAPKAKKVKKEGGVESMLALAARMLKEEANKKTIRKAFTKAYAAKGKDDADFIKKRINIYMKIAGEKA